jgi:hypothetical protein
VFTAASGLLAAPVIAMMSVLQAASDRGRFRHAVINTGIGLGVFAIGYVVASPPLAHHMVYQVKTATEFFTALGRSLAWPRVGRPELAVLGWLPMVLVAAGVLRRRLQSTELERFTLGVGAWVALHAVALAYGRGAGGAMPATRYMDFLSLGFVANAMALTCVLDRLTPSTIRRRVVAGALAAWLLFGLVGLNGLVRQSFLDLDAWKQAFAGQALHVRRFVLTDDTSVILGKAPIREIPYPDANVLLPRLQDPYIRRILPAAVRAPILVTPGTITENSFVRDGVFEVAAKDPLRPSWGSFSSLANRAQGRFESEPIESCTVGGALKFEVAGHLGFDDHTLAVRDVRSGRETRVVRRGSTHDGWGTATVACPSGPFTIVATDDSRWSWFAFRPPVEVGTASMWSERLIDAAWPIFLSGLIFMAAVARWTR